MRCSSWISTAFWSSFLCSVNWYFCTRKTKHISSGVSQHCVNLAGGIEPGLLLSQCQRSLPPDDEVSLASSSWSRRHWEFWGPSYQKCQFWCLWQWQTSGEPCAEELCSKPRGLQGKTGEKFASKKAKRKLIWMLVISRPYQWQAGDHLRAASGTPHARGRNGLMNIISKCTRRVDIPTI